jgi:tyrosine-protein phosphatase SIW14
MTSSRPPPASIPRRSICDEYRRFSHPKSRTLDQQFIELFDVSKVHIDKRHRPEWL